MINIPTGVGRYLPYESRWSKRNLFYLFNQYSPMTMQKMLSDDPIALSNMRSTLEPATDRALDESFACRLDPDTPFRHPLQHWLAWALPRRSEDNKRVRNCPECARHAYHSYLYNFVPLEKCPFHDFPLEWLDAGMTLNRVRDKNIGNVGGTAWDPENFCPLSRISALPSRGLSLLHELHLIIDQAAQRIPELVDDHDGAFISSSETQDNCWDKEDLLAALYAFLDETKIGVSKELAKRLATRPRFRPKAELVQLKQRRSTSPRQEYRQWSRVQYEDWANEHIEAVNARICRAAKQLGGSRSLNSLAKCSSTGAGLVGPLSGIEWCIARWQRTLWEREQTSADSVVSALRWSSCRPRIWGAKESYNDVVLDMPKELQRKFLTQALLQRFKCILALYLQREVGCKPGAQSSLLYRQICRLERGYDRFFIIHDSSEKGVATVVHWGDISVSTLKPLMKQVAQLRSTLPYSP